MATKKQYEELAAHTVQLVGGKENISYFTHCVTRLRFNLKDRGSVHLEEIKKIPGVLGAQWSGDQLQIIIGQSVGDVYQIICEKNGLVQQQAVSENLDAPREGKKITVSTVLDMIAGCLTPLIPMMIGAGLIKVILMLLSMCSILTTESSTYIVLDFAASAAFYFFPVMIGSTAAKKFGANPGIGMMLGATLISPTFISLVNSETPLSIYGLPIYAASYANTVFSMILTMAVCAPVEKFFAKHSPKALRTMLEPVLTILVMLPLMLCVLAPLGSLLGSVLAHGVMWLYDTVGFLGVAIFCALQPLLITTGMHTAFTPYLITSLATVGYDPIVCPPAFVSNVDHGIACVAVALKTKDKNLKSTAFTCAISAITAGVTEPALFGIILPLKTPMYATMIGNFFGGAMLGLLHVFIYSFPGGTGLFGLPIFLSGGITCLLHAVLAIAIGAVATFISTFILYRPENV